MKSISSIAAAILFISLVACNKSATSTDQLSLAASTTLATVGQTVAVTLTSDADVSKWTVTPSTASKTYSLTTSKVNNFTFAQAGTYTISVSAKSLAYDSTGHQSLDSCWNHAGGRACVKGIDSTSIKISVVN